MRGRYLAVGCNSQARLSHPRGAPRYVHQPARPRVLENSLCFPLDFMEIFFHVGISLEHKGVLFLLLCYSVVAIAVVFLA